MGTMHRNGNFGLVFGWGGNTTHIHDFCIPLDFLGIKDLKKKKSNAIAKATKGTMYVYKFTVAHFTGPSFML